MSSLGRLRVPWALRKRQRQQWRAVLRRDAAAARWLLPWLLSQQSTRSPLGDEVPWIPFRAVRWLEKQLTFEARVFEWGSGGSTLFFARRVAELASVEHDGEWYSLVRKRLDRRGSAGCSYHLVPPDPQQGPPNGLFGSGQPGFEGLDFEAYVKMINKYRDNHFDLILVDGRARLACLHAAWSKVCVGGHIILDNSNYERYQGKLASPAGFESWEIAGVSPYRGDVWTQSTVFRRALARDGKGRQEED